jgi:phage terminase small subunit
MGKRGPAKTPTAIKIARGTRRAVPANEPQPPTTGVVMPAHLGDVAAARWRQLLPMLQSVRVMTQADIEALARYCDTYEWWLATRAKLKRKATRTRSSTTVAR